MILNSDRDWMGNTNLAHFIVSLSGYIICSSTSIYAQHPPRGFITTEIHGEVRAISNICLIAYLPGQLDCLQKEIEEQIYGFQDSGKQNRVYFFTTMATDITSTVSMPLPLIPSMVWVVVTATMLFSLVPSPLQGFLLSIFSRGKTSPSSTTKIHKFMMIPQRLFLHFYIIGAVFNGFILILMLLYTFVKPDLLPGFKMEELDKWRNIFLLFLFELQVTRRLYENLYVSKFSPAAKMHVGAYLLGLIYYVMVPLSFFPRAKEMLVELFEGHVNLSSINGFDLSHNVWENILQVGWQYWLAAVVFIWGSLHQYRCHSILATLRSNKEGEARAYKIPYGDWFEYVSCAHYFAEIVIYSSLIIATKGQSLDVWLLFIFVVVNLSIAAVETHQWYKTKFESYPSSRKAIIPFVL